MLSEKAKQEMASVIAAYLNKHGNDRKNLPIADYEFNVLAFTNILINMESINELPDGLIQFNGTAQITKKDPASQVTVSGEGAFFHGVAFFSEDVRDEDILLRVEINQLKNLKV